MKESVQHPKVIIIGAGLAGLTATHLLKKAGLSSVLLLEASDRVGGRIRNLPVSSTVTVEGGAAWVGPTQTHLLALAQELGVATFPTYNEGRNVFVFHGKRSTYRGMFPGGHWIGIVDTAQAMLRLERMAKRIDLQRPWQNPHAKHYDSVTLQSWLEHTTHTRFARVLFDLITAVSFGCTPCALSLLHFLVHIRSAGSLDQLTSVQGAALEQRFVGGSEVLTQRLAERLGESLKVRTPVTQIIQESECVLVKAGDQNWQAEQVIVAMSPADTRHIQFVPSLFPQRIALMHRWTSGTGMKVHAVYDAPFWREQGLTGQAVSDEGVVRLTFDSTPPEGKPGILTGFMELPTASSDLLAASQLEERRRAVIKTFACYFGEQALSPCDYLECNWTDEPWIAGCVPALSPGVLTECGSALHAPIERIHWAGAETSALWEGHMEGAVRSAERTVQEILRKG